MRIKEANGKVEDLRQGQDLRVFPALVVDTVHVAVLLVVWVFDFGVEHFGLIEQFMMEA